MRFVAAVLLGLVGSGVWAMPVASEMTVEGLVAAIQKTHEATGPFGVETRIGTLGGTPTKAFTVFVTDLRGRMLVRCPEGSLTDVTRWQNGVRDGYYAKPPGEPLWVTRTSGPPSGFPSLAQIYEDPKTLLANARIVRREPGVIWVKTGDIRLETTFRLVQRYGWLPDRIEASEWGRFAYADAVTKFVPHRGGWLPVAFTDATQTNRGLITGETKVTRVLSPKEVEAALKVKYPAGTTIADSRDLTVRTVQANGSLLVTDHLSPDTTMLFVRSLPGIFLVLGLGLFVRFMLGRVGLLRPLGRAAVPEAHQTPVAQRQSPPREDDPERLRLP